MYFMQENKIACQRTTSFDTAGGRGDPVWSPLRKKNITFVLQFKKKSLDLLRFLQ
jgi:hypothetical protein